MENNTMDKMEMKPASSPPGTLPRVKKLLTFDNLEDTDRSKKFKKAVATIALPIVGFAVFLGLWELATHLFKLSLPGPIKTVTESWQYIAQPFFNNGPNDKGLGLHLLSSLGRVGIGYSLAAIVGVVLGILVGRVAFLYKAVDPIFQLLRTVPPLAWLPIALAIFTKAVPSEIFVIFITALWPILINTTVGVMRLSDDYQNVARVYQIKGLRYFFKILLPASAPFIFTGLRISIGMAWLAIVAAEMLTGGVGIGFFIWDSWNSSRMSDIVISVFYVGLVGLALDRMVAYAGKFFGSQKE